MYSSTELNAVDQFVDRTLLRLWIDQMFWKLNLGLPRDIRAQMGFMPVGNDRDGIETAGGCSLWLFAVRVRHQVGFAFVKQQHFSPSAFISKESSRTPSEPTS
jgi:hypothetical protein